jgi:transcription elongation factor Elf1
MISELERQGFVDNCPKCNNRLVVVYYKPKDEIVSAIYCRKCKYSCYEGVPGENEVYDENKFCLETR